MSNILEFPVPSKNDKQFLELEKQQKFIEEQRKKIEELTREKDDG